MYAIVYFRVVNSALLCNGCKFILRLLKATEFNYFATTGNVFS